MIKLPPNATPMHIDLFIKELEAEKYRASKAAEKKAKEAECDELLKDANFEKGKR